MADSLPDDAWLIRPCEVYKEEYKDCKAWLSRLYQHYIDGQRSNCDVWWTDYQNCMKFRNNKDLEAAEAVLESERERRKIRLQNAKANDIWEYRTSPPSSWSAPLASDK